MYTLLGYRRFHSDKTDEDYCTASFISKLSKRDEKAGFMGRRFQKSSFPGMTNFMTT